jgi:hypothetical protein
MRGRRPNQGCRQGRGRGLIAIGTHAAAAGPRGGQVILAHGVHRLCSRSRRRENRREERGGRRGKGPLEREAASIREGRRERKAAVLQQLVHAVKQAGGALQDRQQVSGRSPRSSLSSAANSPTQTEAAASSTSARSQARGCLHPMLPKRRAKSSTYTLAVQG